MTPRERKYHTRVRREARYIRMLVSAAPSLPLMSNKTKRQLALDIAQATWGISYKMHGSTIYISQGAPKIISITPLGL